MERWKQFTIGVGIAALGGVGGIIEATQEGGEKNCEVVIDVLSRASLEKVDRDRLCMNQLFRGCLEGSDICQE